MAEHDLEALYREAQSALKMGDYERAAELLKHILREDHEYRDVSRLLADTVKLRRRRWYSHPLFWSAFGLIVVVSLGFFAAPRLQEMYAAEEVIPAAGPTMVISPTKTEIPTELFIPSPTPIAFAWKRVSLGQEFARDIVTSITIDPTDPDVLYAGMENAGMYKSIDGGLSWYPVLYGLTNIRVETLLVDAQDTNIVYAGTASGIFKTENGGENWARVGGGTHVLIDPTNNSHLYARDDNSIYESTDQGKNWKSVYSSQAGCPGKILSWAIHPMDGKTLYLGGGDECERGIYQSNDGGRFWTLMQKVENPPGYELDPSLDYLVVRMDWLIARLDNGNVRVDYGPAWETPDSNGLVYSYCEPFLCKAPPGDAGGEESVRLGKPDVGTPTVITVSPHDPDTIYVTGEGVAVTNDGGQTWSKRNNGLGNKVLHLETGAMDGGILYGLTKDCQKIYIPLQTPISGSRSLHDIWQSLFRSPDGGQTWILSSETGCYLVKDANGTTLYRIGGTLGGQSIGWIWRSNDGGKTFEKVWTSDPPSTLTADINQSGLLFIYFLEWDVWTKQQYYSEDYGRTWKVKEPPMDVKLCYGSTLQFIDKYRPMTIDPSDGNHVFVIDNGILLESHDSCDTTEVFASAPNKSMNSIAYDPNNPGTVYAGTDSGVFVSFDSGKTWNEINDGLLGATVVYSIVADKDGNVYAATPYGIFKLESK